MKICLREPQSRVFTCDQRFRVLVAGRRFGKTYLALTELCRAGWERAGRPGTWRPRIGRPSGLPENR